jgi:hypothetical protein
LCTFATHVIHVLHPCLWEDFSSFQHFLKKPHEEFPINGDKAFPIDVPKVFCRIFVELKTNFAHSQFSYPSGKEQWSEIKKRD